MTEAAPAHALISASGFKALALCAGKLAMEKGQPDNTSQYAAWGTVAHDWAAALLTAGKTAISYDEEVECEGFTIVRSEEMADCVNTYIKHVRQYQGDSFISVENRLHYADALGLPRDLAWGTGDTVILHNEEIVVIDLKTGMGVEVNAERNDQMMLYALGALLQFGDLADFKRVRVVVSQPRISEKPSEWDCTVEELWAWAKEYAAPRARTALVAYNSYKPGDAQWEQTFLNPAEDACRFCKAKATCPALRGAVAKAVSGSAPATPDEFDVPDNLKPHIKAASEEWLSASLKQVDLIEEWCKAVRAEVERRLLAGEPVPDFKLVAGKKGNRAWSDAKQAEELLKTFRLKQEEMYDLKLISPTTADKLAKAEKIGKRQWPKLAALITQSDGKPHVAPADDPRQAISVTPAVDDFTDVTADDIA